MRISVNQQRVGQVLDTLVRDYQANAYPYNQPAAQLPQQYLPPRLERGSAEHAMFLFCLCYYMRGGIKSVVAARYMAQLFNRRPELFDADKASEFTEISIRRSLERIGLHYMKNIVPGYWIENAKRLSEWHSGDPRKIYVGTNEWDDIWPQICNASKRAPKMGPFIVRKGFQGFQHKMASMLTYYLMDAELIPRFDFPAPVDFHLMRIAVATEMLDFEDLPDNQDVYGDVIRAILREVFLDYTVRRQVDPIELTNAVWLLSNTLCSRHPGNRSLTTGGYQARSTSITPYDPVWNETERRTNDETCGSCPIRARCAWDIPNAEYTRKGQMLRLRPRSTPPPLPQGRLALQFSTSPP